MAGFNRDFNDHGDNDDVKPFHGGDDAVEPESSNLPMVIVISLLVLAAFGGVVWVAYNNGVAHGRGDAAQVATVPEEGPPAAPTDDGAAAAQTKSVKAYQQQASADDDAPPPVATKPPAQLVPPSDEPAPAKPAVAQPAPTKPAPEKPVVAKPAPAKPAPVATAPAKPAPVKPVPVKPAPAKPVPAKPMPATPAPAAKTGGWVLQLGAYTSESDATAAWKSAQAKFGGLLSGHGYHIQKADTGGGKVWYRLRVTGFADKDAAAALCAKLKAGGGACFPSK